LLPSLEPLPTEPHASFRCTAFNLPFFPFKWHVHPEYELTLIVEGRGKRYVGDSVADFQSGEVVLLGSNLPHTWHSKPASRRRSRSVVIQFREDCFGERFFGLPELTGVRRLLARAAVGLRFTGDVRKAAADAMQRMVDMEPSRRMTALLAVLDDLSRSSRCVRLSSRAQTLPPREHDQTRIDRVLRHVNQRYTQPINQAQIAAMLHLSASAFSRFFRRVTGRTFVDFVQHLRVQHAARLLIDTDRSITQICYDSGFGNLSNFNRRFRERMNCSPRQHRARYQA
jgi:AraC-like DNA-binding protein